jgi:hypothetical protein
VLYGIQPPAPPRDSQVFFNYETPNRISREEEEKQEVAAIPVTIARSCSNHRQKEEIGQAESEEVITGLNNTFRCFHIHLEKVD